MKLLKFPLEAVCPGMVYFNNSRAMHLHYSKSLKKIKKIENQMFPGGTEKVYWLRMS